MKTIMIILLVNSLGAGFYETKKFNTPYACHKEAEKLRAMPENRHNDYYCVKELNGSSSIDNA